MDRQKINRVVEELRRNGFDLTSKEFYQTTVYKILKKYQVTEKLTVNEYYQVLRELIELCAENDLKDMGLVYMDEDDWKDK